MGMDGCGLNVSLALLFLIPSVQQSSMISLTLSMDVRPVVKPVSCPSIHPLAHPPSSRCFQCQFLLIVDCHLEKREEELLGQTTTGRNHQKINDDEETAYNLETESRIQHVRPSLHLRDVRLSMGDIDQPESTLPDRSAQASAHRRDSMHHNPNIVL